MATGPVMKSADTGGGGSVAGQQAAADAGAVGSSGAKTSGGRPVVLVTGLSGAGRSSSLKILEDLGYEAVDNLPLSLIEPVIRADGGQQRPLALGCDIRARDFAPEALGAIIDRVAADPRLSVQLLFLDCDDDVLRRRFTETRRRHPLATDRPVMDGIARERRLLAPLRERAGTVIDTSALAPQHLRRALQRAFATKAPQMLVTLLSFAYREGLPREADLVLDVRFLRNPHYVAELKPLTGLDASVAAYVRSDPAFAPFVANVMALLNLLLPRYEEEGKSYLTIAIGCSGGRHRSVAVVECLVASLAATGRALDVHHRELAAEPAKLSGTEVASAESMLWTEDVSATDTPQSHALAQESRG